jgi:hypothetical protein
LGAVGDLQLGEDVRDIVAHGLGTQVELLGDGGIGVASSDQVQYLSLAVGESRKE